MTPNDIAKEAKLDFRTVQPGISSKGDFRLDMLINFRRGSLDPICT